MRSLRLRPLARCLICALLPALAAQAALDWQPQQVELHATTADEQVVARYTFTNKGDSPERIGRVQTGCDCAKAEYPESVIAPGASGELTVNFHVGNRVGRQMRSIEVHTVSDEGKPTRLGLTVNIEELLVVRPRLVFWKLEQASESKTVTLRASRQGAVKILSATCVGDGFACRLGPEEEGGARSLTVSAPAKASLRQGHVLITYSFEGRTLETMVYLALR